MKIFYSNRIEMLLESFKKEAFEYSSPFTYRHVITPTLPIEEWIKIQLAVDPHLKIGAGLNFSFLNPALQLLLERFFSSTLKFPSLLEIKLGISEKISEMMECFETLSIEEQDRWRPLFNYLRGRECFNPKKQLKRFLPLVDRLATLFNQYSVYGFSMVEQWEKQDAEGWQIDLWETLFGGESRYGWRPFFDIVQEFKPRQESEKIKDFQLHLFAFSHLSEKHFEFLKTLSTYVSISIYHLSFCMAFWQDSLSDRENRWVSKQLESKKIHDSIKDDFLAYLRDRHRFLANTGKVGKKQAELYENSGIEIYEHYVAPFKMSAHPLYENDVFPELYELPIDPPNSFLPYFQLDLLLLKNPEKEKIVEFNQDDTCEVYAFSSKYQEISNLYQRLIRLIDDSQGRLTPQNFLVMAPDITVYAEQIKTVFGSLNSQISYHILDEKRPKNRYFEAFSLIIDIDQNRWNASSVLKLFSHTLFQQKQKFTESDLQLLEKWVEELGIRWGFDLYFQKEQLEEKDPHHQSISLAILGYCTWKELLERHIQTLFNFPHIEDHFPSLTFTQTDLIGKIYSLILKLYSDSRPINDGSKKTSLEWYKIIIEMIEYYFDLEDSSYSEFKRNLDDFLFLTGKVCSKSLTFTEFFFYFEQLFSKENQRLYSKNLDSVVFCSLLPMRAIPAEYIFMIGMNYDQFPRKEEACDFNFLLQSDKKDYMPSKKEFDRSLFLEAVLSARKGLSISFISKTLSMKQNEPPSSLVEEFLSFINRSYHKKNPTSIRHMPEFSTDPQYFMDQTAFVNHSQEDFTLAKLSLCQEPTIQNLFFPSFQMDIFNKFSVKKERIQIDLKDLLQSSKSPLKPYFHKNLHCNFESPPKRQLDEERFSLNALENYHLKNLSFKNENTVLKEVYNVPKGLMGDLAKSRVFDEVKNFLSSLNNYNLKPSDLFSIELHRQIENPEWSIDDKRLWLPPLTINLQEGTLVNIIGVIEKCSPLGVFLEAEWSLKSAHQNWPLFLVLESLKKHYPEISSNLIFVKKKNYLIKPSPGHAQKDSLSKYLKYHLFSLSCPSPLFSDWCEAISLADQEALKDSIESSYSNPRHVEFLRSCQITPEEIPTILKWQELYLSVYDEHFKEWSSQ